VSGPVRLQKWQIPPAGLKPMLLAATRKYTGEPVDWPDGRVLLGPDEAAWLARSGRPVIEFLNGELASRRRSLRADPFNDRVNLRLWGQIALWLRSEPNVAEVPDCRLPLADRVAPLSRPRPAHLAPPMLSELSSLVAAADVQLVKQLDRLLEAQRSREIEWCLWEWLDREVRTLRARRGDLDRLLEREEESAGSPLETVRVADSEGPELTAASSSSEGSPLSRREDPGVSEVRTGSGPWPPSRHWGLQFDDVLSRPMSPAFQGERLPQVLALCAVQLRALPAVHATREPEPLLRTLPAVAYFEHLLRVDVPRPDGIDAAWLVRRTLQNEMARRRRAPAEEEAIIHTIALKIPANRDRRGPLSEAFRDWARVLDRNRVGAHQTVDVAAIERGQRANRLRTLAGDSAQLTVVLAAYHEMTAAAEAGFLAAKAFIQALLPALEGRPTDEGLLHEATTWAERELRFRPDSEALRTLLKAVRRPVVPPVGATDTEHSFCLNREIREAPAEATGRIQLTPSATGSRPEGPTSR